MIIYNTIKLYRNKETPTMISQVKNRNETDEIVNYIIVCIWKCERILRITIHNQNVITHTPLGPYFYTSLSALFKYHSVHVVYSLSQQFKLDSDYSNNFIGLLICVYVVDSDMV